MKAEHTPNKTFIILAILIPLIIILILSLKKCGDTKVVDIFDSQENVHSDTSSASKLASEADQQEVTATNITKSAEALMAEVREIITQSNDTGDIEPLLKILGPQNLNPSQIETLKKLAASSELKLEGTTPYNRTTDGGSIWQLNLLNGDKIELELTEESDNHWQISKSTYTPQAPEPKQPDSNLAFDTAEKFVTSLQKLNPTAASQFIDNEQISYSTIAGLCMIFEEGQYSLLDKKSIREMFSRDTTAGYLVRLHSLDSKNVAAFGMTAKRKDQDTSWMITEINLDQLLADYAQKHRAATFITHH